MYDLYSKRKIEYFFSKDMCNSQLVISASMKVVDALNMALARNDEDIYEPIIVFSYPDKYRILDFYDLVLAQNEILNVMNSLLKEANEFKNEVLAIVAHDLKNPLGAIRGFAGLITESNENNSQCKFYAETISNAAIHMEELVTKFLLSAINDSTEMKLHNSYFNIKEAIESVIKNVSHLANAKNQMIQFNVVLLDCEVYSDKLKISEVIVNLVSYAFMCSYSETQVVLTLL
jgi:signal transduction histidine kinase